MTSTETKLFLDVAAQIHEAHWRTDFRREVLRVLFESTIIRSPVVHHLEMDFTRNRAHIEDQSGPALLQGVPLGDYLPGRQDDLPSFQYSIAGALEPTILSQFLAPRVLRNTGLYSDVNRPLGTLDVLYFPVCWADTLNGFVYSRETCFTEKERQVAVLLQRQITIATKNNLMLLHAESRWGTAHPLRKAGVVLRVRVDGSVEGWNEGGRELFAVGDKPSQKPERPPDCLLSWLRRQVAHYPWLSPEQSRTEFAMSPDALPVQVHFIGRRNGLHEALCFRSDGGAARFALTARETEALRWLCQGKRNEEIALILNISPFTVRNHVEKILKKLGVENRGSAAAMARGWFS